MVWDTANAGLRTFKKIAPSLNKITANKVGQVVERSIQQVITQSGIEIKRIAPKIIRQALPELYKTLFIH